MTKLDYANPTLRREIGLFGAVMLGLGSILGTGVFVSLAHATELAGPWVLLAIVLAGLLAYCNAMSSAQLAAAYPVSGGTYEYGYRVLNPALGFTAGWMFLLAKSASAATAALGIGHAIKATLLAEWMSSVHGGPNHIQVLADDIAIHIVPTVCVFILILASLAGLRRTNISNSIIVSMTLGGLLVFVFSLFGRAAEIWHSRLFWTYDITPEGLTRIASATALSFVAFTGYGRLATLGEEVRDPATTIPRAIILTLLVSISLYLAVGFIVAARYSVVITFEPESLTSIAADFVGRSSVLVALISLAAVTAMLGVLLNLILGLSRVWLAMGRRGDMPRILARVNEKTSTPVPATILSGGVIALLVLVGDVRTTWSFSAFTVLIYYAITNWAALKLAPEHRRFPRFLAWIGLFACLSLAWFVDMKVWIAGTILIAIGLVWHRLRRGARASIAM
jgi:APA family basic amino acid/polyamine antiporter